MIWVPPPHWMIAILIALIAHLVVVGVIFYARGWKRGALSMPVGFALFAVSVVAGILLGGAVWQMDPLPLLVVLAAGVYGTYALMMWRPRRIGGD